jgi:hypothetical protein
LPHPTWIESAVPQELLAEQGSAHALVLIAHPDEASRQHPGHGFVADVLQANGLGALPFSLQAPGDDATGGAAHGTLQDRLRLRSALAWVVAQPATRGRPVALIGVDRAVPACAALAHRASLLSPRSLVLFDGRLDPVAIALARLQVPTLYVVGECDARLLVRHRAALRKVPASHGVEILPRETWPAVAPGAFEALARAALSWFARTLLAPAWEAGSAGGAAARAWQRTRLPGWRRRAGSIAATPTSY